ncbi:MAG TPA: chemotaxis protein CheW [Pyrinomonadaceae bacterium]|jgi:purine-binding chemotaxis protein CheW|nr:chemotaxis protein CheW [Pyrinomonadaceae bacterium]
MNAKQILRERARALARREKSAAIQGATIEVLEFRLAQERYAIECRWIQEVHSLKDVTAVPCTPPFLVGIVNVRGRILAVLDLKKFLDLPSPGITDLHCIILVRRNDCEVGILADVIVGVRSISVDDLQLSLPTLTGVRSECIRGVTAESVVVLDLERIFSDPRIIVHEEVEA